MSAGLFFALAIGVLCVAIVLAIGQIDLNTRAKIKRCCNQNCGQGRDCPYGRKA